MYTLTGQRNSKYVYSATIGPGAGGLPAAISQIEGFSHFRMPFVCL